MNHICVLILMRYFKQCGKYFVDEVRAILYNTNKKSFEGMERQYGQTK